MKTFEFLQRTAISLGLVAPAWAQENVEQREPAPAPIPYYAAAPAIAPYAGTPLRLVPGRSYPTVIHEWIGDMERAGVVDRSMHQPYRVALPLMTFGENGPVLKLTYARTIPGSSGARGPFLFVHIPID